MDENAVPLLFLHGWPGSFLEVTKMLGPLTGGEEGKGVSFHVIAPSLVDFGFSDGSRKVIKKTLPGKPDIQSHGA